MSKTVNLNGQCLCGAVKIKLNEIQPSVGACHCTMCRNWTGGPFMSLDAGDNIEISGEDNISVYNSSEWAERSFCKQCGTNLFYRLKQNNGHHVLAGLFDLGDKMKFEHQIFIDEKPNFYNFAEETHNMTGAEVMAMFAGGDES